ncbi:hypothetical protein MMC29_002288 [Sticta canariensis]|nr:hypothetical protein [Sticta canariensis]
MGLDLMDTFPSYLGTVRQLDSFLHELEEPPIWTLEEILRHPLNAQNINKGKLSQPATTAIQIALVNLSSSWNIKPVVTVGHSSGEIGSAYAASLVTARYAIIIAYLRGKAITLNKKHGSMLAVGLRVEEYISDFQDRFENVVVACHNSPESSTFSGNTGEIMAVKEILEAKKVFARVLVTDGNAYHSLYMIPVGSIYEKEIIQSRLESGIQLFQTPEVSMISTVTRRLCTNKELGANYWRSNLESPVLFEEALEELVRTTLVDTLIEIGPYSALRSPIQQIARSVSNIDFPEYVPTLIRSNDGLKNVLDTAGI